MQIGAQLFTIRQSCKTLDDFAESLKRIADIGYKTVQVSGVCYYEPEWLKEQLSKNGLKCVLTHALAAKLQENPEKLIKDHNVFDCKYIGLGSYDDFDEENGYEKFGELYTRAMDVFADNGKYFMYHNHDAEFKKYGDDIILAKLEKDFAPEKLGFTLDTFWVQAGGGDPAYWLERLSGRVPCIHLKDYAYGQKMAVLGEGNLNFDRIFEKAEKAGTEYMLVEQDKCYDEDPFDCLKRSYEYLKSRGFE